MRAAENRILELDGLRGIAIFLVILFHLAMVIPESFQPALLHRFMLFGWSGVDLFFVLSGFLIGGILVDNRNSERFFQPFYARRFFRIIPAYFAVVALLALIRHLAGSESGWIQSLGPPMPWPVYLTFTNNLWQAAHNFMDVLLPVTWSLAVEEQFYLSLPMLVRFVVPTKLPRMVLSTIAIVLLLRIGACLFGFHQVQVYVLPFFRADSLMVGVACALLIRKQEWIAALRRKMWILYAGMALIAVLLFAMGGALPEKHHSPATPMMTFGLTLVAVWYAGFLLLALLRPAHPLCAVLRLRPLRYIGKVSYCLYLIHQPLITLTFFWLGSRFPHAGRLAYWLVAIADIIVMLLLAESSWRLLESKLIPIGHRFRYTVPVTKADALPGDASSPSPELARAA